mmetsp:Transcript_97221/g.275433  ORF Transcript_97221/g.275433 Transcript_97221/m.275433 type:complete len:236 (+) Transcript_97221:610-1317(+)
MDSGARAAAAAGGGAAPPRGRRCDGPAASRAGEAGAAGRRRQQRLAAGPRAPAAAHGPADHAAPALGGLPDAGQRAAARGVVGRFVVAADAVSLDQAGSPPRGRADEARALRRRRRRRQLAPAAARGQGDRPGAPPVLAPREQGAAAREQGALQAGEAGALQRPRPRRQGRQQGPQRKVGAPRPPPAPRGVARGLLAAAPARHPRQGAGRAGCRARAGEAGEADEADEAGESSQP